MFDRLLVHENNYLSRKFFEFDDSKSMRMKKSQSNLNWKKFGQSAPKSSSNTSLSSVQLSAFSFFVRWSEHVLKLN